MRRLRESGALMPRRGNRPARRSVALLDLAGSRAARRRWPLALGQRRAPPNPPSDARLARVERSERRARRPSRCWQDGFDSLEEDFAEEQFFAAVAPRYWAAPMARRPGRCAATLIQRTRVLTRWTTRRPASTSTPATKPSAASAGSRARRSRRACCPRSGRSAACSASSRRFEDPVLVSSADGVGTKLKVAFMAGRHDTVGAGPRQPLRQRHPRPGRRAAVLPGLPGDRASCRPTWPNDRRRHGARVPRERLRAARRRDRGDAGLLRRRRIRLAGFIVGAVERERLITGRAICRRRRAGRRAVVRVCTPTATRWPGASSFDHCGLRVDSHVPELGRDGRRRAARTASRPICRWCSRCSRRA